MEAIGHASNPQCRILTVDRSYTESNSSHQFDSFTIKTRIFNLIINRLTYNTYVLLVLPPGEAELQCAKLNILRARDEFARIESVAEGTDYRGKGNIRTS